MRVFLSLIAVAALAAGCDEGQSQGIALDFEPLVSAGATNALVIAPDFEVTRLDAYVTEVKCLPGKDDDKEATDTKFKAKGDFHVDAVDPEASVIPTIELPAETYKKVEFKFDKPKDGAGLDGTDAALALDATIDGVMVEFRLDALDKFTLRDVDGIALASGMSSAFLVDLDVQGWFDGVDVTALDAVDGVVVIDGKNNKGAFDTIKSNIKATIKIIRKPAN